MDTRDLATFATVARLGGMGRAARALNTVQSNVTQRVRRLEESLGVALFERSRSGARLTAAGARLMPYAGRLDALLEEASRAARDELAEFMGRQVHLFLRVALRENWLDEAERYREMGLDFRDGD